MPRALDTRLVVVTGKGGVGKTTVALALALLAARRGRRALLVELAGRTDAGRPFGRTPCDDGTPEPLAPGVTWLGVDTPRALAGYVRTRVPVAAVARRMAEGRALRALVAAAPGLEGVLCAGAVADLAREGAGPWDLVVLDAPATGHALAMLGAPRTYAEATRAGPVAAGARDVHAVLADPQRTGVVLTTALEELAVNEAVMFREGLVAALGRDVDAVVANRVLPAPLPAAQARLVAAAAAEPAARSAMWLHEAAVEQRRQQRRAARLLAGPPRASLPFLFRPRLNARDIAALACALERRL